VEVLKNSGPQIAETGLQYVHNDACYPAVLVVGQFLDALKSGLYDPDKVALIMSQTGGGCRASNYIFLIRKALENAGLSHIPVISFNLSGLESHPGFRLDLPLLYKMFYAVIYGDLLMHLNNQCRPYEKEKGSANRLAEEWTQICIGALTSEKPEMSHRDICRKLLQTFDELALDESIRKPRVGIVGEILVKYMPLANNDLVGLLEREGAEAVVPDLLDFFNYCAYGNNYRHEFLGGTWKAAFGGNMAIRLIQAIRSPALKALKNSRRFEVPVAIEKVAELAKPILSIGNQYGEGWFLTGEMAELLTQGVNNIVCIQPFACLPNHVVGKGAIKQLKRLYPKANIAAVDYDPGASEVNQLNRIKLMLAAAKAAL